MPVLFHTSWVFRLRLLNVRSFAVLVRVGPAIITYYQDFATYRCALYDVTMLEDNLIIISSSV